MPMISTMFWLMQSHDRLLSGVRANDSHDEDDMNPKDNRLSEQTGFWSLRADPSFEMPALPDLEDQAELDEDAAHVMPQEYVELFEAFASPVDPTLLSVPLD